jgi:hypothetical protein
MPHPPSNLLSLPLSLSLSLRATRRMNCRKYSWEAVLASGWTVGRPKNCNIVSSVIIENDMN